MDRVQPHNVNDLEPDPEAAAGLRVGVVIPVYNRSKLLSRTLASLAAQEATDFEVHVCDDGSEEDIRAVVDASQGLEVRYHNQPHDGFGAGRARNMGAFAAAAEVILFLDSDCVVPPGFIDRHRSWHRTGSSTVVVGTRTNPVEEGGPEEGYRGQMLRRSAELQHGGEGFRAFVSSNVSVPSDLFRDVGGFDERFRWWGSEDTELGWRLWQAGATFVRDPELLVDHLLAQDSAGGAEGRREARRLNSGLLASLVPHHFYRKRPPSTIPATPKVSVILHDVPPGAAETMWLMLLDQPRTDFELVIVADPSDHDPFAGAAAGDPRLRFADSLEDASATSRSQYLCFLNGHGAPSQVLLSEVVKRLDQRPEHVTATVGYALPRDQGGAVRTLNGARAVDDGWGVATPLCWFIRKREVAKLMRVGADIPRIWAITQEWDLNRHWPSAAVRLPGLTRTDRPDDFTNVPPHPRRVVKDLIKQPRQAADTFSRYARARGQGSTYTPVSQRREKASPPTEGRPQARYVGWTGRFNLGDDVMVARVRELLDWADIAETGDPQDLILLGGGTLINMHTYLRWVSERDSPRIERATLGTGVASPEFWGLTEDPGRWARWLASCAYVGVRGPQTAEILRSWGFKGEFEICGDSALLSSAGEGVERQEGRVVVAPVWTKGELWGGSDANVVAALAGAVSQWRGEGREVVCLASSPEDDGQILQLSQATGGQVLPYLAGYRDPQAAIDLLASAEVVIGERLHACILAAAVSTPFVGVEYRPKLGDFAESVGRSDLLLRTDELSPGSLTEMAVRAIEVGTAETDRMVETYRGRLRDASILLQKAVS
ncbi:MAG TPA: glycosyltransferase [Acidimicrobiia bacterium]|nr:glycosyltransferase [Acidimicrobiia bacterium]